MLRIVLVLLAFTTVAHARPPGGHHDRDHHAISIEIVTTEELDDGLVSLLIEGQNFLRAGRLDLHVGLGGLDESASCEVLSDSEIECVIAQIDYPDGDYRLSVWRGTVPTRPGRLATGLVTFGAVGPSGADGSDGTDGAEGPPGEQGSVGPPGLPRRNGSVDARNMWCDDFALIFHGTMEQ